MSADRKSEKDARHFMILVIFGEPRRTFAADILFNEIHEEVGWTNVTVGLI